MNIKNKLLPLTLVLLVSQFGFAQNKDSERVKSEHGMINISEEKSSNNQRTKQPDAQWFPDAGFGLFIHWGLSL